MSFLSKIYNKKRCQYRNYTLFTYTLIKLIELCNLQALFFVYNRKGRYHWPNAKPNLYVNPVGMRRQNGWGNAQVVNNGIH